MRTARKLGRPRDLRRHAARREQILQAAAPLFARHGYADTDTQLLADSLQIGKGTLYRYFPSKRALFLAAADRGMQQLSRQVDAALEGVADPLDRIAVGIRTYLAFFAEHPEYVELLIQERAQFRDRAKPTYFEHRDKRLGRWHDLYRQLMRDGRLRPMPVERVVETVSNLVYGTMFTNYFTGQTESYEAQTRAILDLVFHGILSEQERKRRG